MFIAKKVILSALLLLGASRTIHATAECDITPTGTSVGYSAAQEGYLFVFEGNQPYRLGPITDPKAVQRYATALTAISLGKQLHLYYYGVTTNNNCADIYQADASITYVMMK
jgi:hypothetical protein